MQSNGTKCDLRPMTADELMEQILKHQDAARRRYSSNNDGAAVYRSLPRKAARKINSDERRKLEEFGDQFYEGICNYYWMGLYAVEDGPYIEEALETLSDGSVRYSATFLPKRFAPDLPKYSE